MSEIIGDTHCEVCRDNGGDATGNHRILFADGGSWCSRCETNGLREGSETRQEVTQVKTLKEKPTNTVVEYKLVNDEWRIDHHATMSAISKLKPEAWPERKLTKQTMEHFDARVAYNQETRQITDVCYPVRVNGIITGWHVRTLPKDFCKIGNTKGAELFGQHECTSFLKLWATEGAEDCMSSWQVLKAKRPDLNPSTVALSGTKQLARINEQKGFLEKFKEKSLCLDMGEEGREATTAICQLDPSWKDWHISEDDASDMLQKGKTGELVNALFQTKDYTPDSIVTVEDAFEEAIELPKWGRLWPWSSLNKLTYGRRGGEGIYVGAAVKAGKTEWKNQMIKHIIVDEGLKVFSCSFEQSAGTQLKAYAGKLKHKQFHNPEHVDQGKFTQEDLTSAVEELRGKVIMFKASFSDVGVGNMWDRLKPAIRHAVVVEGVKDVFIDPITQLTDGMTPSETETELRRFSNEIQGMAQELDFFYYCFAHLKEPPQGKTHEEGGAIKVAQFRGSRAMAEKTKLMLGIIRNQFSDEVSERNMSTQHLLLNSGFGKSGKFDTWYDEETGSYLEPKQEFHI